MRNLIILTYKILIFVLPYIIIVYMFPTISKGIDDFTWTQINQNIVNYIDSIWEKIWLAKDSTDTFIDNVWTNTKNKRIEQTQNIIEIQEQ